MNKSSKIVNEQSSKSIETNLEAIEAYASKNVFHLIPNS